MSDVNKPNNQEPTTAHVGGAEQTVVNTNTVDTSIPEAEPVKSVEHFLPAGEFSEPNSEDLRSEMLRGIGLASQACSDEELNDYVREFSKGLRRDEEGKILFKDEAQRDTWETIRALVNIAPPTYNVPPSEISMVSGTSIQECDPERFTAGVERAGDNKPFTATKVSMSASGVLGAIRKKRGTGASITLLLPATGIYVSFSAPSEDDYCNYEVTQAMNTSQIGQQTFGMLMSAASGVYLESMVMFSLNYAVSTSYNCGDLDIQQALLNVINPKDYGIVLWGPIIAKFPGGIPWDLEDPVRNTVEEVNLNLLRCIRTMNERITPEQREMYTRNAKPYCFTDAMLEEYAKLGRRIESQRFVHDGFAFYFQDGTLASYFESTSKWAKDLEVRLAEVLGNYPTDMERAQHTSVMMETQRLLRYAHRVGTIAVLDENGDDVEATSDSKEIIEILKEFSEDRLMVNAFEKAIATYDEDSRLTAYGYMPRKKDPAAIASGPMRGFIPLSPDKVFFMLSRAVYEVQKQLTEVYANAG